MPRASPRHLERRLDIDALAVSCRNRLESCLDEEGKSLTPVPLPLLSVEHEAEGVVTLWVDVPRSMAISYSPGQYYMCWNPYDAEGAMKRRDYNSEKPYSVGDIKVSIDEAKMGFTVKDLGRQSGELTRMARGDWLALRGPFGTTFPTPAAGDRLLLISGGIGSTPMHMAAKDARNRLGDEIEIVAVMGFKNAAEVHYIERMQQVCDQLHITTDDGSMGTAGFPTAILPDLLVEATDLLAHSSNSNESGTTRLYTCGPEPMMKAVLKMAVEAGVESYAAMERYLPCSMAVCGLCMVGDKLTCVEGPVMEGAWLLAQDDFGAAHAH